MQQVSVRDSGHAEVLWSNSNQKVKQLLVSPKQLIRMKHGSGGSRHSAMMPQANHHIFKLTNFICLKQGQENLLIHRDPPTKKAWFRGKKLCSKSSKKRAWLWRPPG
uniref:Uncharacterized protein LOC104210484 n=1 Tax=Nicotiana sylvestris TaxID=4096 RepID=A0A1U7UNG7_NICSY|nr:PREDICTED: uncharacterized protein LOC104210484 [Nicotiana sylvestris]